ncbi:hypothetical protein BDV28DRAFT_142461 [Aspergillus coremiiformis]|uniref:Uncharacterized protein n=1 Tax=Aspergillus coremiiformis TaxID=138285 RepID=A0A5N6YUX0_9EURO|nr:hypothetical protein BDV28DRAFT_142461 [Aspergillus coremiiformis]
MRFTVSRPLVLLYLMNGYWCSSAFVEAVCVFLIHLHFLFRLFSFFLRPQLPL